MKDNSKKCNHLYSKTIDQKYPRKCLKCGKIENKVLIKSHKENE